MYNREYFLSQQSIGHNRGSEDDIWTSARCNRLLRSINSRIIALRKALRQCTHSSGYSISTNPRKRIKTQDPSWIPDQRPKKYAKTYFGKSIPRAPYPKKKDSSSSRTILPSPFVRKIRDCTTPFAQLSNSHEAKDQIHRDKRAALLSSSATASTEQKLVSAFAFLLNSASSTAKPCRTGSRSLFDMCARKVPYLLTLERDDFEFGRGPGISQETASIYTYLEGEFETSLGRGAPMLRSVVRAHGVSLVCNAISENLLSDITIHNLVKICHVNGAIDDGIAILQAWFKSSATITQKRYATLTRFCEAHDTQAPLIQVLSSMSHDDLDAITAFRHHMKLASVLPTCLEGWREPKHGSCTDYHQEAMLQRPIYGAASLLTNLARIAASVTHSEDQIQASAMSADMQSTAATIALMALGDSLSLSRATWQPGILTETLYSIAAQAVVGRRDRSRQVTHQNARNNDETVTVESEITLSIEIPFVIAAFILLASNNEDASHSGALDVDVLASYILAPSRRLLGQKRRLHPSATDFVHHFGRSVATFDRISGADLGLKLLTRLTEAAQCATPVVSSLLRALSVEIATRSSAAQSLNRVAMASKVTALMQSHNDETVRERGGPSKPEKQYRWEDGLCEWVTATPRLNGPATPRGIEQRGCKRKFASEPCSPDVLALSPVQQRKRHSFPTYQSLGYMAAKGPEKTASTRTRSRTDRRSIDDRYCDQYSEDELGS